LITIIQFSSLRNGEGVVNIFRSRQLIRCSMIWDAIPLRPPWNDQKRTPTWLYLKAEWALLCPFAAGLVAKDESQQRAHTIPPKALAVMLLPGITTVKVVVLILSASFQLVAAIAPVEIIPPVTIVPAKVRRLIIAIPVTPLRGNRQRHHSYQHQSH
jgi:hypothetical protein